jgi:peptide deformylase
MLAALIITLLEVCHKTMAILEILEFPDPRLRTLAKAVLTVDNSVRQLLDDMFETMYAAPGIGLAAPQINIHQRIVVIDVSEDKSQPLVFINPTITVLDNQLHEYDEGCLSVPGFYEMVVRPEHISVTALDRQGKSFTLQPTGLLAVCIQHELDHLNGKLFVDHISPLKRSRIRKKLEKKHKEEAQ